MSLIAAELGYGSLAEMHKGLAGYQVDALALGISSMKRGDGFIEILDFSTPRCGYPNGLGTVVGLAAQRAWVDGVGQIGKRHGSRAVDAAGGSGARDLGAVGKDHDAVDAVGALGAEHRHQPIAVPIAFALDEPV